MGRGEKSRVNEEMASSIEASKKTGLYEKPQGMATRIRILEAIKDYREKNGFSITVREIGDRVGLNAATVHKHLEVLKKQGKIDWNPAMRRTIRVLDEFIEETIE
jgi:SOS-response transcriptional repressor LexA